LANESLQRKEAQNLGTRLADALSRLELQQVKELFASDKASVAVAHLARMLRQNPTNRVGAQRLVSSLTERNFALPLIEITNAGCFGEYSPDDRRLLTASRNGIARIWDANTGRPMTEPLNHEGAIYAARFSPDGSRFVTAGGPSDNQKPGYAQVWNTATGRPLTERLIPYPYDLRSVGMLQS
jgi:WD40 repeat protein